MAFMAGFWDTVLSRFQATSLQLQKADMDLGSSTPPPTCCSSPWPSQTSWWAVYIEICWFLGDWVCTLYYTLDYVITSASVVNMVLISLDRYVAVCDPLRYPSRVTTGAARLDVCLCWFSSVVFRLLLVQDHIAEPGRSSSCLGECVTNGYYTGVVDTVFTFILPIAVILVLYGRVFSAVLAQARTLRSRVAAIGPRHPGAAAAVRRSELKAAHTLGIVVVVFLICFCPYYFPALEGEDTSVDASSAAFEIWLAHFNQLLPLNRNQQQGLYGGHRGHMFLYSRYVPEVCDGDDDQQVEGHGDDGNAGEQHVDQHGGRFPAGRPPAGGEAEFCVPQLNSSCRRPARRETAAMLVYVLLSSISVITVALNLLVIVSIAHFRHCEMEMMTSRFRVTVSREKEDRLMKMRTDVEGGYVIFLQELFRSSGKQSSAPSIMGS
ncbi:unnamed protein product [Menidia menidia]|uniref:(Atlantic silverside) hypothetical protein n=1 Tax=Menidia menidia TaxID=238744 RepID=A0A8S4BN93_9TELE|nr:unnamed protein product [Menidia menidia]